jgi:hypothetical protein
MEAQVFAGRASRRQRLEARNKNKCGKPILVGRKERNVSRVLDETTTRTTDRWTDESH